VAYVTRRNFGTITNEGPTPSGSPRSVFAENDLLILLKSRTDVIITEIFAAIGSEKMHGYDSTTGNVSAFGAGIEVANARLLVVENHVSAELAILSGVPVSSVTHALPPDAGQLLFSADLGKFGSHSFRWNERSGIYVQKDQRISVILMNPYIVHLGVGDPSLRQPETYNGPYSLSCYGIRCEDQQ
jgi:hypothetical protein